MNIELPIIQERVNKIIADKLCVDESELKSETVFIDDLGADSLDMIELIMEVEKEFNISVPNDDTVDIQTVGQLYTYLDEVINPVGI